MAGLGGLVLVIGFAFGNDVAAAFDIWLNIPTFTHCFLIPAISAVLIWNRREVFAYLRPAPTILGLLPLVAGLVAWWVADAALLTEAKQLAIVVMLQGAVLALLGYAIYRALAFPLLYLVLMVPFGTPLLPPLQGITTFLAVSFMRLAGVSLFVEGNSIETATGTYVVAPGCAGLNFVLVALAVSLLFAWTTYRGTIKRLLAVVIAVGASIVANGLRVFGIIWLAEITNRHIDIIDDHLFYGWVFLSVIMLGCLWVGRRFADPMPAHGNGLAHLPPGPARLSLRPVAILAVAVVMVVSVAAIGRPVTEPLTHLSVSLPERLGDWQQVNPRFHWKVDAAKADWAGVAAYRKDGAEVEVFTGYLHNQDNLRKITAFGGARPVDAPVVAARRLRVQTERGQWEVVSQQLGGVSPALVWTWYWIGGQPAASTLDARLNGVRARLKGDNRAAVFSIATAIDDSGDSQSRALADFLANAETLERAVLLDTAASR